MKLKPKILACLQLPPPVHGAAIMNQYVINSHVINDNFSVDIIPFQFASSISDLSKFRLFKFVKTFSICYNLICTLIRNRYKFVYFTLSPTGYALYRDLFFIIIIKIFRVKILYHLHGKGIKQNSIESSINRYLYKYIFNGSYVIVLTKNLADDIDSVYSGKPFVVNNGIPTVQEQFDKKKIVNEPVHILYLSNLVYTKGIFVFVEALLHLYKNGVLFKASIVGNDSYSISLESINNVIVQKGISNFVEVTGPLYGYDKHSIINTSDIFCFPTFKEAFGLVLLEAMQFGKPIVSTFEGGIPEIVDNGITGLLVKKQNSLELAQSLQYLIDNEDVRIQMGKNGQKKFYSHYTLNIFEKNLLDVFKTVIGTN